MKDREKLNIWLAYVSYPATTAVYFERALRSKYNVVTVGPSLPDELYKFWDIEMLKSKAKPHNIQTAGQPDLVELKNAVLDEFHPDVYFWVESVAGFVPTNIDKLGCPTACYLIDSHINLQTHLEIAKDFDYIFIAQKEYINKFKEHVHDNVFWLPLGADPDIHSPKSTDKLYDVGFVGSVNNSLHERRKYLLEKIDSVIPVFYKRCFLEEMSLFFSQSKIVFNNAIKNDLNMRVFEAMSVGSLLLTDRTEGNGQTEMFTDGIDYVLYNDENIIEKVQYYLEHEEERERIAAQGRKTILNAHTYFHRTEELLDVVTGVKTTTRSPEEWKELSEGASVKSVVSNFEQNNKPGKRGNFKNANETPERSFVIPVIDYAPYSKFNIKTLLEDLSKVEGEVVVVFNSMDVYEELKEHPRIDQFAAIKKNVGVSRAWNIGLNIARSKIAFILNSDLQVEPEAIYALEEALEKLPMAAIVGPQGSYLNYEKMEGLKYFDKGSFDKPIKVDDVSGFFFAVKTELFNSSVIHFDNSYTPCYSEEWDIALQCKMAGLNLYIVPTTAYEHHWGGSIGDLDREIEYYDTKETAKNIMVRNRVKFLEKWKALAQYYNNGGLLISNWADEQLKKAEEIYRMDTNKALQILESVLNIFPNHIPSLELTAKIYSQTGNLNESLKYLSHIEKIDPNHVIDSEDLLGKDFIKQQVI